MRVLFLLSLSFLLSACAGPVPVDEDKVRDTGAGDTSVDTVDPVDPGADVYQLGRVVDVAITMDRDDWNTLRRQTRDFWATLAGEDCQADPFPDPFTWFPADVTIDGETLLNVGVRKKGFLGSLSETKPALKLDFGEYGESRAWEGLDTLTLNNALQDPSYVRQCLGYSFFGDAGVPASRCGFARVSVNGQSLGLYANVEPIKKPLLGRFFEETDGNLYEGTLSDFREGWTGTFEKKTNEDDDDWSDIEAVVEAMKASDADLLAALDPVVDLDAFYTFWAAEVLVEHQDGYANNTNNFYLYDDPSTGRFRFLPWGIDAVLPPVDQTAGGPQSVYAWSVLANRLYGIREAKEAYLARLGELLDAAWDEDVLSGRLDEMEAVLSAELSGSEARAASTALRQVRDAVTDRRAAIEDEIAISPYRWTGDPRPSYCFVENGTLSMSFATTWGSLDTEDPFSFGEVTLAVDWAGADWTVLQSGAVAGESEGAHVLYAAAWVSDTEAIVVYFTAPEDLWAPGTVTIDLGSVVAGLFYIDTATMSDFALVSYIIGDMTFDLASTADGDPVSGTLEGDLLSWGF